VISCGHLPNKKLSKFSHLINLGVVSPTTGCKTCRQRPMSDENLMLSLAMTDHYFDMSTLERMGRSPPALGF
jgi:hypothetical protein